MRLLPTKKTLCTLLLMLSNHGQTASRSYAQDELPILSPVAHSTAPERSLSPGGIPVLMYHDISCPDTRYTVCPSSLYEQLEFLHEQGFRAITMEEFLHEDVSRLAPNQKPYLLTFDDSPQSQFFFGNDNRPSPQSAVGVIETFRNDYGVRVPAYFFVITGKPLFGEPERELEKVQYIQSHDFGIGNHTASHLNLQDANLAITLQAFGKADRALDYVLGQDWGAPKTAAYPFGALPLTPAREHARVLLGYDAFFHAYGGLSKQQTSTLFDITAINRYETNSTSSEPGGIRFFLERFPIAMVRDRRKHMQDYEGTIRIEFTQR